MYFYFYLFYIYNVLQFTFVSFWDEEWVTVSKLIRSWSWSKWRIHRINFWFIVVCVSKHKQYNQIHSIFYTLFSIFFPLKFTYIFLIRKKTFRGLLMSPIFHRASLNLNCIIYFNWHFLLEVFTVNFRFNKVN